MKIVLFLPFCSIIIFACCKDKNEPSELPPLTHSGKNTFGCYLDGEPFVAKTSFSIGGAVPVSGNFDESTKYLIFQGTKEHESGRLERVNIFVYVTNGADTYSMWANTSNYVGYTDYSNQNCEYFHDQTNKGIVTITFLDETKNIISGIFEMTLINSNCTDSTMVISDGRFDFGY